MGEEIVSSGSDPTTYPWTVRGEKGSLRFRGMREKWKVPNGNGGGRLRPHPIAKKQLMLGGNSIRGGVEEKRGTEAKTTIKAA